MEKNSGLDRREFLAGTAALGATVAGEGATAREEMTVATATIDGLQVNSEGKSFWVDAEAGPWASVIVSDPRFAEAFASQDLDRYLGLVGARGRTLFDRDTAPGAEPEEIIAIKAPAVVIPGDDPSHPTSAAHYLRELMPKAEYWPVMPPDQTPERVRERILEFRRAVG